MAASNDTIGVGVALTVITVGAMLVYTALKGKSAASVLSGDTGAVLDPSGGGALVQDPATALPGTVQDPSGATVGGGAPGLGAPNIGGFGSANMETEMQRMVDLHQPYKWGGGHASFSADGPWDCSGAVSWLTHWMGLLSTSRPITSTGFMLQGKAGRGSVFTIYANPTHVFIIMETGAHKGQAWGTANHALGLTSPTTGGPQWHTHSTVGFTPRHYEGY